MSKRKYLVLARSQRSGGRSGPSPEQMQQMFAAFNAWKDGPFVEVKEVVGGFMIVSAETYDGAVEVVRAMPAAPGASFEIREMTAKM